MNPEKIGMIGLGTMGWQMAANLCRAGHSVLAYDIEVPRREKFSREFSTEAPRCLADLAAASIVITMLPNGAVVRQALTDGGDASLVNTLEPGSVVLDTTSSVPAGTREMGALLARRGVGMVDAGVSGAVVGATEGNLVFMIGGEDAAVERVQPVLSILGKRMFRMGPLGSGHAMKAMNNLVSAAGFAAACEALIIGRRVGLDPAAMIEVFNASTGRNFSTEKSMGKIAAGTFDTSFSLGLFAKDVKIAADLADEAAFPSPMSHAVCDWMAEARDNLGGERDHTVAYTYWDAKRTRE